MPNGPTQKVTNDSRTRRDRRNHAGGYYGPGRAPASERLQVEADAISPAMGAGMMKVILTDLDPDDWILGVRAAKWLLDKPLKKDAVMSYGDAPNVKDFYVKRNKASITIRECHWHTPQESSDV